MKMCRRRLGRSRDRAGRTVTNGFTHALSCRPFCYCLSAQCVLRICKKDQQFLISLTIVPRESFKTSSTRGMIKMDVFWEAGGMVGGSKGGSSLL